MMNNLSLILLLLSLPLISFPINAQTADDAFCEKFPLNSRCQEESAVNEDNSAPNDSRDNQIVDLLTIDEVERYLKELGYIDVTRNNNNSLNFLMQGRPCSVFIASNGKGMSLFSYYPQDEKTTLEAINDWNKSLRYSFAYLYTTTKNDELVVLETNLTVTGGVTESRIKSFFVLHSDYQAFFGRYLSEL
ncbi:exported hypothetical protein [Hyella patelloides LEGE 07179]|uniref:YbjN domain-containing protein n=1 Tax=Hyella patelloides LEGE 07179 TaxID=945734 RepID=A0A563VIN7_9CYAN|nr:YbjN domain-containing protein [Hyella patelloides]VEP11316.1 exported hypothetical protein [Hyella patelloides LEGE 07179]